jgi:hypothetical protein
MAGLAPAILWKRTEIPGFEPGDDGRGIIEVVGLPPAYFDIS